MEPESPSPYPQVPATCPYPEPARSSPYPHIPLLNIILPSIPGSPKWSFSLRFPHQNPVYASPLPHMCYMPCPAHSSRFITWTILREEHRSLSSSFCSFLHSPLTSSLLGPNILFNTLFSNTFSLRSSLIVSGQGSHPVCNLSSSISCFSFQHFHFLWCSLVRLCFA